MHVCHLPKTAIMEVESNILKSTTKVDDVCCLSQLGSVGAGDFIPSNTVQQFCKVSRSFPACCFLCCAINIEDSPL